MYELLARLSGNKSMIASVIMGIVAYLATTELIGPAEVTLITTLVAAIFKGVSVATGKIVYDK